MRPEISVRDFIVSGMGDHFDWSRLYSQEYTAAGATALAASFTFPETSAFLAYTSGTEGVVTFLTLMDALSIAAMASSGVISTSTMLRTYACR